MMRRNISPRLASLARQYPVVILTAPRQSGKTTLVKATFPDRRYVSLEDPDIRQFASTDPRGGVSRLSQRYYPG